MQAAALLTQGLGLQSPSMIARRKKRKPRVEKEVLAAAVRRHFNALAVNENEVLANLIYVSQTKGTLIVSGGGGNEANVVIDDDLRLRFTPVNPESLKRPVQKNSNSK
jgi:hypothetical protein